MSLLRTNAKLAKTAGPAAKYLISGLTLAPHGLSGHQVCEGRSVGCAASCNLWFAGQRVTPQARAPAIADTQDLFTDRASFVARLNRDIAAHVRKCDRGGLKPLIRLNVASDLDWIDVIENWPLVQFYDYTKIRSRFKRYLAGDLPSNYALTFSRHEKHHHATMWSYLRRGANVAQVFDVDYYPAVGSVGDLPKSVRIHGQDFAVIDGDKHDVRLPAVDGSGVIVGLRLKGSNAAKSRARDNGFAMGEIDEKTTAANVRSIACCDRFAEHRRRHARCSERSRN